MICPPDCGSAAWPEDGCGAATEVEMLEGDVDPAAAPKEIWLGSFDDRVVEDWVAWTEAVADSEAEKVAAMAGVAARAAEEEEGGITTFGESLVDLRLCADMMVVTWCWRLRVGPKESDGSVSGDFRI